MVGIIELLYFVFIELLYFIFGTIKITLQAVRFYDMNVYYYKGNPAHAVCGQSYKHFTIVIYDSRVVPDWKIPHITTLEL